MPSQDLTRFKYRLLKPLAEGEQVRDALIEKSGITATFTLAAVEDHEKTLQTVAKELAAELEVESAKMKNIEHYHPEVKDMPGVLLTAAALYKNSQAIVEKGQQKLADYEGALKEYAEEKAHFMAEIGYPQSPAEFVPEPSTISPNSEENGGSKVEA